METLKFPDYKRSLIRISAVQQRVVLSATPLCAGLHRVTLVELGKPVPSNNKRPAPDGGSAPSD